MQLQFHKFTLLLGFKTIFCERGLILDFFFKIMDIVDTENVFDKFRDAKELMDRWLIYHNKPVDTMWLSICEELETNS